MTTIISLIQQTFPGKPSFTENNVADLKNKVMIVTGSNSGIGKETAKILYSKNAKVYMMARSEEKTKQAIDSIKAAFPNSNGELIFIRLDLADLSSIKDSTNEFLRREQKLDVLFNNAGVGYPEKGSKTQQGYELQLGVNCIGPFAFTKLLTPVLVSTAKTSPAHSVRVVWVSSSAALGASPKNFMKSLPEIANKASYDQYFASKLGNYFHATEFALRHEADGVLSISLNPGNLDSDFWRTQGAFMAWILRKTVLYPAIFGAYTSLFAAFSPEITLEKSGSFIAPWGRFFNVPKDMHDASKTTSEGGTGIAKEFWEWTEARVEPYV